MTEGVGRSEEWKRLRDHLQYDPSTGAFRWRVNICNVKAGAIAGSRVKKGYLHIRFDKKSYLAHRLAWFWMTGVWPANHIDHKNGKRHDNRWNNLRSATNAENLLNRGMNRNNTSGFKGVSFDKRVGKYSAYLTVQRKRKFLGYFERPDIAHLAYQPALEKASPEFGRSS